LHECIVRKVFIEFVLVAQVGIQSVVVYCCPFAFYHLALLLFFSSVLAECRSRQAKMHLLFVITLGKV